MLEKIKATLGSLRKRWQISHLSQPIMTPKHDVRLLRRLRGRHLPKFSQITHMDRLLKPTERVFLRIALLMLVVGVVWIGWNFTSRFRVSVPTNGGSYTEAVVGAPQYINPIFASSNDVDMDLSRLVFSGLLRYDEKHRLLPDLAAQYSVSEDKKVYTFNLRKDVLWHDGEQFTAKDVVFTFETIMNPAVASPLLVSFQGMKVSLIDDYTVSFTLPEAYPPFLNSLTVGIIPEHAWFDITPEQMRLAQLNVQPIGTGPFKFSKLSKDDSGRIFHYELTRFDRYYREQAYLDSFAFNFYADFEGDNGSVYALRGQKVDGLSFVPHSLRDQVERKHIVLHTVNLPQETALFFNSNHNVVLDNKNVRLALAKSVDAGRIVNEALKGEGEVIHAPILPGFPGYSAEAGKRSFSYEEANKLLDEKFTRVSVEDYRKARLEELIKKWKEENPDNSASSTVTSTVVGSISASSTTSTVSTSTDLLAQAAAEATLSEEIQEAQTFYRKDKDGNILSLEIVTVDTEEYTRAANLIAGFWQNIGVKTSLRFVKARDLSRDVLRDRSYDILLYGEIVGDDPDPYPFWHSSQVVYPGLNLANYVNRSVDEIIVKIRSTSDAVILEDLYKKFQSAVLADQPAVFLYMPTYTYATSDMVKGMSVSRISHPSDRLGDVTHWYVETKQDWKFK
ncbi:MAG TPA: ABC transporter substrate-binding protein [Candidatus Magasanikbacteria bacterium]|nr:ABC transporter substrate-binding protein [Candidatus Magasanikbacteria bacterium]